MTDLRDAAMTSKAWPFEEARRVLKRYEGGAPEKGYVLFETGYGPSGLPHIGTFGEVLRTTIREQLEGSGNLVDTFTKDLTDEEYFKPAITGGNHTAWAVGHTAAVPGFM